MSKKENKLLIRLKSNSLKLRANYQIPLGLVVLINKLDQTSSKEEITFLSKLSEHYIRVYGYYSRYKELDRLYTKEIYRDYQLKIEGLTN